MQWRDPWSLAALGLVAGLAAFLVWAWRRRQRALAAFVEAVLQPIVSPDVDPRRRRLRAGLLVTSALLLVVALAGPMWGFRWEQVERRGIDLVIALDTSRSMLAGDVKPNRLARAKLGVRDLVAAAHGDRLALVPFAGTAFLQCPLTLDTGAFLQSLDAVEVGIIPRGGTALAAAIDASLAAFEGREANHQAVVLITDGESHEGDLDGAIARAKERGVRIFTVGIGTAEGELLPGEGSTFLKDRKGQLVKSRLDQATLERIAVDTGGVFLHAAGAGLGLTELYRDHIATLDERELESTLERRYEVRYQIPLALAFLLLLLEPLLGDRRTGDRQTVRGLLRWRRGAAVTAALALAVVSLGWLDPHARAREGNRLYAAEQFDDAAKEYNQALVDEPDSARLHFNLGDARYKAGKYDEALASFEKAPAEDADPARTAHLAYNVGNTKYRQGAALEQQEPQKTMALWNEALAAYRRALGADPDDVDAKFNHELVEKKLAALRKRLEDEQQQKQQQQQDEKQKQNEKEEQNEQQKSEKQQEGGEQQEGEKPQEDQGQQQAQEGGQQQSGQQGPEQKPEQKQEQAQQRPESGGEQEEAAEQRKPGEDGDEKGRGEDGKQNPPRDGQPSGTATAEGGDTDRLDREEAAALLDAQRTQEVQPGEIVRRLDKARVAEPREDW